MIDAPTDLQILELENRFYRRAGARAQAVHDELGLSLTAYAARLLAIVEAPTPEVAQQYGPLINRMQRKIDLERSRRVAGRGRLAS